MLTLQGDPFRVKTLVRCQMKGHIVPGRGGEEREREAELSGAEERRGEGGRRRGRRRREREVMKASDLVANALEADMGDVRSAPRSAPPFLPALPPFLPALPPFRPALPPFRPALPPFPPPSFFIESLSNFLSLEIIF